MERRKVILDCDPGHDDAVALMMAAAHPSLELLGVTVSRGNQTLEKTTRNALNICQWLGLDSMPVCPGCPQPMIREAPPVAADIHGESGLEGPVFPPCTKVPDPRHAIDFIIETVLAYPHEVTLVITGPMTNVAMAMRREPKIVPFIQEIVFMGGSWGYGNVTPAAEFNILTDAEAAYVVFRSGVPLVMMGLDLTRQALCFPEVVDRMERVGTTASRLFVELMRYFCMTQKREYGWPGGPLHDATCIGYLIDQSCVQTKDMYGEVDISAGWSRGRTNCDAFHMSGHPDNIKVSVKLNVERFWDIVEDCLGRYAKEFAR